MKASYYVDIEIDKLTNSILNTISGDSFETEVTEITSVKDINRIYKRTYRC